MTFAEDYNPVSERIQEFRTKYPEGTLQSTILFTPNELPGWVVEARAYRFGDDERPGYGLAFEPVPGPTSFTRDSELQNCETSAWGRALIAVGAADAKKGIASAEDIENRPTSTGDKAGQAVHGDEPKRPVETSEVAGTGEEPAASVDRVEGAEASLSGDRQETAAPAPSHVHGEWSDLKEDGTRLRPAFCRCTRPIGSRTCNYIARKSELMKNQSVVIA